MKETPVEKLVRANFEPGKLSKNGFLGDDTRHIHDIIQADRLTLAGLGITQEALADKLQYFIEQGKKVLEGKLDLGEFVVQIQWSRGALPCPFGEPGLYHKIVATVFNKKQNKTITYSQLNVHMIKVHGFFEGKGSSFRLEPDEVCQLLNLGG